MVSVNKDKVKSTLKELIGGLLAEKGFKAGLLAGLINGIFFLFVYLIIGEKLFPVGVFSFAREIFFVLMFVLEGALIGLIYGILYDFIPFERALSKAILFCLAVWFLIKFLPFYSLMFENPIILVDTLARYLLKGTFISIFWNLFTSHKEK